MIGVVGHSVGAGAAILSASQSPRYGAVVSVSSFAHPGEMMREQMDRLPSPLVSLILEAIQFTIGCAGRNPALVQPAKRDNAAL